MKTPDWIGTVVAVELTDQPTEQKITVTSSTGVYKKFDCGGQTIGIWDDSPCQAEVPEPSIAPQWRDAPTSRGKWAVRQPGGNDFVISIESHKPEAYSHWMGRFYGPLPPDITALQDAPASEAQG
jgi:hypothetical protein